MVVGKVRAHWMNWLYQRAFEFRSHFRSTIIYLWPVFFMGYSFSCRQWRREKMISAMLWFVVVFVLFSPSLFRYKDMHKRVKCSGLWFLTTRRGFHFRSGHHHHHEHVFFVLLLNSQLFQRLFFGFDINEDRGLLFLSHWVRKSRHVRSQITHTKNTQSRSSFFVVLFTLGSIRQFTIHRK